MINGFFLLRCAKPWHQVHRTQDVLQQVIHSSLIDNVGEAACVFADCAQKEITHERAYSLEYFSILTWGNVLEDRSVHFHFLDSMIHNKPHARIRTIVKRAMSLMYVCKKKGLGHDMRRLIAYVLNNLEVDVIVLQIMARKSSMDKIIRYVKNGMHNRQHEVIGMAIRHCTHRDVFCWLWRRLGLKWKPKAIIEELICMNMEECFLPFKVQIFNQNGMFSFTNTNRKYWSPVIEAICKEKTVFRGEQQAEKVYLATQSEIRLRYHY